MRVQNLDEDTNVTYKCDTLTHKKFKVDITLKINPLGVRFTAPIQTDTGAHPVAYVMGNGSLSQG